MEQVEVISVQYTNREHTQVLAYLKHPDFEDPIPFYLSMENNDDSEIYQQIKSQIDSGELIPREYEIDVNILAQEIRVERDHLLKDSDRYLLEDYPLSKEKKEAVLQYRQALRDLPQQEGFPLTVVYPKNPMS